MEKDIQQWIPVKNKPKSACRCFVIHKEFYPGHPIQAVWDGRNFTFGPHNYAYPSTVAIEVTHYMIIPELR